MADAVVVQIVSYDDDMMAHLSIYKKCCSRLIKLARLFGGLTAVTIPVRVLRLLANKALLKICSLTIFYTRDFGVRYVSAEDSVVSR